MTSEYGAASGGPVGSGAVRRVRARAVADTVRVRDRVALALTSGQAAQMPGWVGVVGVVVAVREDGFARVQWYGTNRLSRETLPVVVPVEALRLVARLAEGGAE